MGRIPKRVVQDNQERGLEKLCGPSEQLEKLGHGRALRGVRHKPQPEQADRHDKIQMESGLHPAHFESRGIRREGMAKRMIAISEKYALEIGSPTSITSERQHEEYLSVLDKLASKEHPTRDEEKYAEVLMTLIEAYEEAHQPVPDASPVEVLRALMEANDLRQKDLVPIFGTESIVSEILHKKRDLNKTHIEKLSKRFRVSPAVFF
jgi:HTH-type transcriptional regulator/antitoxin HigA